MIFHVRFPERFRGHLDTKVSAATPTHAVTVARQAHGFYSGSVVLEASGKHGTYSVRVGKEHPEDIGDLYEVREIVS